MIGLGYTFHLEPTATYSKRKCVWILTPGLSCTGILTVLQVYAKKRDEEQDVYGVEELPPDRINTRKFILVNLTDPSQEEPYEVVTGHPTERRCRCDAGAKGFRRTSCKHKDSMQFLADSGKIPAQELAGA